MANIKALAEKFWENAEKAVGKYEVYDASDKYISKADIEESVRHTAPGRVYSLAADSD